MQEAVSAIKSKEIENGFQSKGQRSVGEALFVKGSPWSKWEKSEGKKKLSNPSTRREMITKRFAGNMVSKDISRCSVLKEVIITTEVISSMVIRLWSTI